MGDEIYLPFTPEDMTTSHTRISFQRKFRGLMDHFEQREKYPNILHFKMDVLDLAKDHFGQLDGKPNYLSSLEEDVIIKDFEQAL